MKGDGVVVLAFILWSAFVCCVKDIEFGVEESGRSVDDGIKVDVGEERVVGSGLNLDLIVVVANVSIRLGGSVFDISTVGEMVFDSLIGGVDDGIVASVSGVGLVPWVGVVRGVDWIEAGVSVRSVGLVWSINFVLGVVCVVIAGFFVANVVCEYFDDSVCVIGWEETKALLWGIALEWIDGSVGVINLITAVIFVLLGFSFRAFNGYVGRTSFGDCVLNDSIGRDSFKVLIDGSFWIVFGVRDACFIWFRLWIPTEFTLFELIFRFGTVKFWNS